MSMHANIHIPIGLTDAVDGASIILLLDTKHGPSGLGAFNSIRVRHGPPMLGGIYGYQDFIWMVFHLLDSMYMLNLALRHLD
jgi:hypothetical protein